MGFFLEKRKKIQFLSHMPLLSPTDIFRSYLRAGPTLDIKPPLFQNITICWGTESTDTVQSPTLSTQPPSPAGTRRFLQRMPFPWGAAPAGILWIRARLQVRTESRERLPLRVCVCARVCLNFAFLSMCYVDFVPIVICKSLCCLGNSKHVRDNWAGHRYCPLRWKVIFITVTIVTMNRALSMCWAHV